jgi:Domain of unknown function (DUF6456)
MAGEIAESEFKRESAELMRRLRLGSGYLLKDGRTGGWSLWSRKNALSAPVGKVADPLVCEMQRRDLLKSRPGGGLMLAQETAPPASKVEVADRSGRIATVEKDETECAIDWLRGRKDHAGEPLLSEEQFAAAERLRCDYTLAQMEQRVTANWERPIESGARGRAASQIPLSDQALAAKDRLFTALSHVGPELSGILLEICCMASGLENAERLLGLPRRSGKAILQIALARLARHYGLLPEQLPKLPENRLRHWGAADYRPPIT